MADRIVAEEHSNVSLRFITTVMTVGIVAVSFSAVLIRLCDAPSLVIAFYRLLFASLVFWLASFRKIIPELRSLASVSVRLGFASGVALALHFATWITSLSYTSVASSVVLVATSPIFIAIGSAVFLHERGTFKLYLGLALAFVGATVITLGGTGSDENSLLGNSLALAGAVFGSAYFLLGRRLRRELSAVTYAALSYSTAAVVLFISNLPFGHSLFDYPLATFGIFLLIALLPQVVGHTSFNWALKHVSAPTVSIVLLGEPVGASLLAYLLLGEKVGGLTIFGGVVTLAGVLLAISSERRKV